MLSDIHVKVPTVKMSTASCIPGIQKTSVLMGGNLDVDMVGKK